MRSGAAPVVVQPGQVFKAFGSNKNAPEATHVQIEVQGQRKWIDIACGDLQLAAVSQQGTRTAARPSRKPRFQPFFDNHHNPEKVGFGGSVDMTPPAPRLDAFDRAVNELCGAIGSKISPRAFQATMRAHPNVLNAVSTFTEGRIFAQEQPPPNLDAYLDQLTDAWFSSHGFEHIYCGELNQGKIGGLHFWGRYFDLQQQQLGGRLPNNTSREEVMPGAIYSVGVEMAVRGRIVRAPMKGYGVTLSAADILKTGTKAMVDNPTQSTRNDACLLQVQDDGKNFKMVFVRKANGIRTLYPDATPSTSAPACRGVVAIR
jgi:hypothetical protein